jgi:hypothetical protein
MKKTMRRLAIRREILQHLQLSEAVGGSGSGLPGCGTISKPAASCANCTPPNTVQYTNCASCEIGPTSNC